MKSMFRPLRQGLSLLLALACAAPVLAQVNKVDPQNLYRHWILLNTSVKMEAPNSGLNILKPGCAAVTYTVGSDGVPIDVRLARLSPKSDLGPAAISAVSNFRYGPSLSNRIGQPVATYYIVAFNAPADKVQREKLIAPCKLPGYGE